MLPIIPLVATAAAPVVKYGGLLILGAISYKIITSNKVSLKAKANEYSFDAIFEK